MIRYENGTKDVFVQKTDENNYVLKDRVKPEKNIVSQKNHLV